MSSGGFVLLIGGAFFSVIFTKKYIEERRLKNNGIKTTGTIVDIIQKADDGTTYSPIIEFETTTGKVIKFEGVSSSLKPKINRQIDLIYDKDNPQDVMETSVSFKFGIFLGIFLIIVGLLDLFSIINLTYESGTPKP
jgi:hypothetical protein